MRSIILASGLLLAACSPEQRLTQAAAQRELPVTDKGVIAFRDICLASAPSFGNAWSLAKRFGVAPELPTPDGNSGMTKDNSMSVQVKPNKECAITTQSRPGTTVHDEFLTVVASKVQTPVQRTPFKALVGGKMYVFQHDRSGGEAYVMVGAAQ